MAEPAAVPKLKAFSASMRVDALLSDWRAELPPELGSEDRERTLYESAWTSYLEGDYGFGLWCWYECDRLTNAFNGAVREVTRVLGPGHYFGFSHRKAVAEAVPIERVYRPRKGDMSTPRTDAIILPHYQALCVYLVRARSGEPEIPGPTRDRRGRARGPPSGRSVPQALRDVPAAARATGGPNSLPGGRRRPRY